MVVPNGGRVHRLSDIQIRNFRSCKECDFPLADFTPLVGCNNGGKSNVLRAISWLLKKTALSVDDFFEGEVPVEVSGTITGITEDLLQRLDAKHRDRIEPFCTDGELRLRRIQPAPSGGVRTISLDIWDSEKDGGAWTKNPTGIDAAIAALFPEPIEIRAMEDAGEDVAKHKTTTTIGKLIAEITAPIQERHGASIRQALDGVSKILEAEGEERAPELKEFDEGANELIGEFFPGISIALHLPPPSVGDLFKSGTIRVYEGADGTGRDISAFGHGAQRSIQMALIRYLQEVKGAEAESNARTLLLIDEPELFLHPQAVQTVRLALRALSLSGYQVVFATHSPQMVNLDDVADCLIIRKNSDGCTFALPTLREAVEDTLEAAQSQAATLFEFENAAQILFVDRVILAEGKTEHRLLPEIYRMELGLTPGEDRTALVGLGGATNVPNALGILAVMGVPAKALVDLDYAFRGAVQAGLIEPDNLDYVACRERAGALSAGIGFDLAEDGFPRKSPTMSAEAAFSQLASDPEFAAHVDSLHSHLLTHDIWLWKRGSLEHHLGMTGKGEGVWARFVMELREKGCAARISDHQSIQDLLKWLRT